jgi:GT2 family glycosyltransferase
MNAGHWQPTARQFYTGKSSVARRHLVEAGGFDTNFRRAEDIELAFRLTNMGLRFCFNPQAVGCHYAERSFDSWQAIAYAYGRNDVIFTYDKGQDWLLTTIMWEYHQRNPLVKTLASICLDRPTMSKIGVHSLKALAALGMWFNFERVPNVAYSGIFNLNHYQGIADELGGREKFFAATRQASENGRAPEQALII